MGKPTDSQPVPSCTPAQELKLYGLINDDPYVISRNDYDCRIIPVTPSGFKKPAKAETSDLLVQVNSWFGKFPACCSHHKRLADDKRFEKQDYAFLPDKIVLQIAQTEFLIEREINKPDWYQKITGYIDHQFLCFGLFAVGLNIYLDSIKKFVDRSDDIPSEMANKISDYILYVESNFKYDVLSAEFFNYEDQTVQNWLQLFPFDLEIFKSHKLASQYFTIPLPYDTKIKQFQFGSIIYSLSEQNLIEYVEAMTLELISSINASSLFQKGVLTDPEKLKLELLLSDRKLQIEKMRQGDDLKDAGYVGVLEKWFNEEIAFLDKLAPLIKERNDLVPDKPAISKLMKKHYEALIEMGYKVPIEWFVGDAPENLPGQTIVSTHFKRSITFSSPEIQEKLFDLLKGYFPGKEEDLKKALNGEQLKEKLTFPHNQNKLVEVFKRLKYNGYILESKYQINRWLRANFKYQYERGKERAVRNLSEVTIKQLLSSGKGEPKKEQRICYEGVDWLPYKSPATLELEEKR